MDCVVLEVSDECSVEMSLLEGMMIRSFEKTGVIPVNFLMPNNATLYTTYILTAHMIFYIFD